MYFDFPIACIYFRFFMISSEQLTLFSLYTSFKLCGSRWVFLICINIYYRIIGMKAIPHWTDKHGWGRLDTQIKLSYSIK